MKKILILFVLIAVFAMMFSACVQKNNDSEPFNIVGQLIYKSEVINRTCRIEGEVLKVVIVIIRTKEDSFFVMESNDGLGFNADEVTKDEQNYQTISNLELNKTYCFYTKLASPVGKYRRIVSYEDTE